MNNSNNRKFLHLLINTYGGDVANIDSEIQCSITPGIIYFDFF
jgi:hypothetical protein